MAGLQKECDSRRQRNTFVEGLATVLHKEPRVVATRVSVLRSENATLQNEFETSSKSHAETRVGLARDLEETRVDMRKKTKEYNALRRKAEKLEI